MASIKFYPNQPHRLRDAVRLVGWMNSMKDVSCDWAADIQHFLWLQRRRSTQYWGQHIAVFTIKITEPASCFIAYVLAKLIGGNARALALIVTWIYIPLGMLLAAVMWTGFSSETVHDLVEGRITALETCSKYSCTACTLRFFARFRLVLHPLIEIVNSFSGGFSSIIVGLERERP